MADPELEHLLDGSRSTMRSLVCFVHPLTSLTQQEQQGL